MVMLSSPAALLLYGAALLLTLTGVFWKKGSFLSYIGGFCWAAGTLAALYGGVPAREILLVTLLLLGASALSRGKGGRHEL